MINRRRKSNFFSKQRGHYTSQIEAPPLRLRWWQQLLILFIVIIVIFLVWYLLYSDKFLVKEITVENNKEVSTEEIMKDVDLLDKNIFLLDTRGVSNNLMRNSEIYDVRLVRVLPNKVKIIITEHKPILMWQSLTNRYYVNQSGLAYKQISNEINVSLPRVIDIAAVEVAVGEPVVPRSFVRAFLIMNEKLPQIYGDNIDFFEVEETVYDLDLILKNGKRIRFNILSDVDNQINELKRLQELRPDLFEQSYIDLRVDRWAYTR